MPKKKIFYYTNLKYLYTCSHGLVISQVVSKVRSSTQYTNTQIQCTHHAYFSLIILGHSSMKYEY